MSPDLRPDDGDFDARERRDRPPRAIAVGRWLEAAAGLVAFTALVAGTVAIAWPPARTPAFAGWTALGLGLVLVGAGVAVAGTSRNGDVEPVTVASWITLLRGAAIASFVGVLASAAVEPGGATVAVESGGPPGIAVAVSDAGPGAWIPALLFAAAGLLDAVDGAVARTTETVTDLGARLDVELDGLTTLVGSVAVVVSGLAPIGFLLVGAARYLYAASLWHRRRAGRPVGDLPPSRVRAPLSAAVLVAVWIALAPIGTARQSILLTSLVAVPFLCNFAWDWLVVTTRISR